MQAFMDLFSSFKILYPQSTETSSSDVTLPPY
uniref:Uncharacterized protein n=1 Tax=Arundo donax TaxID=35708 RepID=A0A0A9HCC4_ARUDO